MKKTCQHIMIVTIALITCGSSFAETNELISGVSIEVAAVTIVPFGDETSEERPYGSEGQVSLWLSPKESISLGVGMSKWEYSKEVQTGHTRVWSDTQGSLQQLSISLSYSRCVFDKGIFRVRLLGGVRQVSYQGSLTTTYHLDAYDYGTTEYKLKSGTAGIAGVTGDLDISSNLAFYFAAGILFDISQAEPENAIDGQAVSTAGGFGRLGFRLML